MQLQFLCTKKHLAHSMLNEIELEKAHKSRNPKNDEKSYPWNTRPVPVGRPESHCGPANLTDR